MSQASSRLSTAPDTLHLTCGSDRLDLIAELGGSISQWSVGGQAMLRAASGADRATQDPFRMGSFPLVPYSNRIGEGSFEWGGKAFSLARNFAPEPHAIHGLGFERAWRVRSMSTRSATLSLSHTASAAWPWPFEATQHFSLEPGALTLDLAVINGADVAVPLAFGHHPYFPYHEAHLKFRARGVWLVGDDGLPSLQVKPFDKYDYSSSAPVARGDIDHCFVGWDGHAEIRWPARRWALEISASDSLPCAVVCIRKDLEAFCFEPVPHMNDAVNHRHQDYGMPVIEPGASFSARIRLRAVDTGRGPGR